MTDRRYLLRALYDFSRGTFVVDELRRPNGEPYVEYRLTMLDAEGGLEKFWWSERGEPASEFFAFDLYPDRATFDADCDALTRAAREKSRVDNLDPFLALIDLVKARAVKRGLADAWLLEYEGLFENGTEDAYTLREMDSARLHLHVRRPDDECWTLKVAAVDTPEGVRLGWGVFALHYPALDSDATEQDIIRATHARALDLDHFRAELDARMACGFIESFMTIGERVLDPDYAHMNDTQVFEVISVMSRAENDYTPAWFDLHNAALEQFLAGAFTVTRAADAWHARDSDMISDFLREMPQPPGMDDQLRSALMDMHGLTDDFDDDSPWSQIDLD